MKKMIPRGSGIMRGYELNGSGCKTCPVQPCKTMQYRGSTCMAQRAKYGLGDPMTNGEKIRAMTDEELAEFISNKFPCHMCTIGANRDDREDEPCNTEWCEEGILKWLRQPVAQPAEHDEPQMNGGITDA